MERRKRESKSDSGDERPVELPPLSDVALTLRVRDLVSVAIGGVVVLSGVFWTLLEFHFRGVRDQLRELDSRIESAVAQSTKTQARETAAILSIELESRLAAMKATVSSELSARTNLVLLETKDVASKVDALSATLSPTRDRLDLLATQVRSIGDVVARLGSGQPLTEAVATVSAVEARAAITRLAFDNRFWITKSPTQPSMYMISVSKWSTEGEYSAVRFPSDGKTGAPGAVREQIIRVLSAAESDEEDLLVVVSGARASIRVLPDGTDKDRLRMRMDAIETASQARLDVLKRVRQQVQQP